MPHISEKAQIVPASPIRKLVPFAEAAKKAGKTVYHLNIGQPDIQTPDAALQAIHNFDDKVLEYSHSAGIESYRINFLHPIKRRVFQLRRKIFSLPPEDPKP